nr:NIN-like protein [Tanacetum cinerariifolium]
MDEVMGGGESFGIGFDMISNKMTLEKSALAFSEEERYLTPLWVSRKGYEIYESDLSQDVRKHWLLTTIDQTFGLGVINDEGLYSYRREFEDKFYEVDKDHDAEDLSPPVASIHERIARMDFRSSALWNKLSKHYLQLDGHRIYQLANEIVDLKQSNFTFGIYYHKLKGLWDKLDAIEAPCACTCKCICVNGKENYEREHKKRLVQFLMGLDECYTNIRGQILLMQPLPTAAKAYTMLRQEEKQRDTQKQHINISTAFNTYRNPYTSSYNSSQRNTNPINPTQANTQTDRRNIFRKGVFCSYCKKEGHSMEECFKLPGYLVGHPLHKKYIPHSHRTQSNNRPRTMNMVTGETSNSGDSISSQSTQFEPASHSAPSEALVYARMDELHNQLNQVLMMMQTNQCDTPGTSMPRVVGILSFDPKAKVPLKLVGNNKTIIQNIKQHLNDKFSIKDLRPLHCYLGIKFLRNATGLAISQSKYALEIVINEGRRNELDNIFGILSIVCDNYRLPLAQTWDVSSLNTIAYHEQVLRMSCDSFDSRYFRKVCMSTCGLPYYVKELGLWPFLEACMERHLDMFYGFVGRELLSRASCSRFVMGDKSFIKVVGPSMDLCVNIEPDIIDTFNDVLDIAKTDFVDVPEECSSTSVSTSFAKGGETISLLELGRKYKRGSKKMVYVKATNGEDSKGFWFTISSELTKQKNKVAKRFKLKSQMIRLKYWDEDNDLILFSSNDDLEFAKIASGDNN